ncbi:hypothetical protein [Streptomyces sp. NPDC000229]|uniref:hypothetical protein n=1 Tax=Streptomyces sp. NPDC000229 TaxID=3154247 RepID=UPI0033165314
MPTSKQDVPMRDLLASCAAANAVSTPPRADDADPEDTAPADDARDVTVAAEPRTADERRRAA